MRTWAAVAELAKAKNLGGGLVARSAPGLPFLLSEGLEVAFVPPQHDAPRRARVESVQPEGKGGCVVHFSGVDSIHVAELLAGCTCLVRREDLPEDALVAGSDELAGFEVRDELAGLVGTVVDMVESPGQLLLSVDRGDGKDAALIPLVDAFVQEIDEDKQVISVALPEGLLDL